jgi:hypothetical protein
MASFVLSASLAHLSRHGLLIVYASEPDVRGSGILARLVPH